VLLGVVAFDLLPEIFELSARRGSDGHPAMVALVVGFLLFHGLEKFMLVHSVHEDDYAQHRHPRVGVLSALALIGHSFMDGVHRARLPGVAGSGAHRRRGRHRA
jgi:ZIP family zinc transporter